MAPHSSTLAWKIPGKEEPGGLQFMGSRRVKHDWATVLSFSTFTHWRRKWKPSPVFLPGESQGRESLVGCHLWGHTESDTTEATWQQQQQHTVGMFTVIFGDFLLVVVQPLSHVWLSDSMDGSTPGFPVLHCLPRSVLKLMSVESMMTSNHLILCRPLLLLPPIPPSIRVFSNESILLMRWPKYWSFSFSISPSNEHPGLTSHQSSPTPQFRSTNSLVLSFLHSPTLTSIHDHWKNHSLD